jgi:hypothetical protein
MEDQAQSPWICHVCDGKFRGDESIACSRCFKTTCSAHLRHLPTLDRDSGLYVLQPVCIACATFGNG